MKELRVICWLIGLARSLRASASVSGHDYEETVEESCEHLSVSVLACRRCTHLSIGWRRLSS